MAGKAFDVFNMGIIVVDFPIRIPTETLDFSLDMMRVPAPEVMPGGDAANSSLVLSKLGRSVALCGVVGGDEFGQVVLSRIAEGGVDTSQVRAASALRTVMSVVMINRNGDRCFLVSGESSEAFGSEDINEAVLAQCRHLNFSSFFAHPKMDAGGAAQVFRKAKEMGLSTSADTVFDEQGLGLSGIGPALEYVDYFLPSYGEAAMLTGEKSPERIADALIRRTGEKTVVIKLGGEGCFVQGRGERFYSDPFVATPVDTTGAGDNFVAGFLCGLLEGMELRECARLASATAAISIGSVGATAAQFTRADVTEWMRTAKVRSLGRS